MHLRHTILYCLMVLSACISTAQNSDENVVFLGDSNIWIAGDACTDHKGWASWFRESVNPASCRSYARSGATWTNTPNTEINTQEYSAILSDNNVILNQAVRLCEAAAMHHQPLPTLILVAAGGNDAWFDNRRPDAMKQSVDEVFALSDDEFLALEPNQVLSLAGAVRYNVLMLRDMFPQAQIVLLTSTPFTKVEPAKMQKVSDVIQQSADRLGVKTIRLDQNGPISRDKEIKKYTNTSDGIHTNEKGAHLLSDYIISQLIELDVLKKD